MSSSSRQRHVVFPFIYNGIGGGSFVSSAILIEQLTALSDWRVTACLPHPGPNSERFREAGARVDYFDVSEEALRNGRSRRLRRQMGLHVHLHYRALAQLQQSRPDLVHINDDMTMLSWGSAARRLGIPVIWHVRQEERLKIDPLYRRIASKIVFIANSTRTRMPSEAPPNATVIHNASDTTRFYPAADRSESKRSLGFDPHRLTVGFVGRLVPAKRPEWAVRVGIEMIERGIAAQFLVVGADNSGEHHEDVLAEIIRQSGSSPDAVQLLGYRQDIPEIMRALDVLMLPSVAEPFGLVVTEAMASGAAVVATNAGGVREIIEHERTGLLAPADDYPAFAAALERLLTDHTLRAEVSRAGRRHVQERFTPERLRNEILRTYESVLRR